MKKKEKLVHGPTEDGARREGTWQVAIQRPTREIGTTGANCRSAAQGFPWAGLVKLVWSGWLAHFLWLVCLKKKLPVVGLNFLLKNSP